MIYSITYHLHWNYMNLASVQSNFIAFWIGQVTIFRSLVPDKWLKYYFGEPCVHDQTHPLNIIGVFKPMGWEFENYLKYASLCQTLNADVIVDRIQVINPLLLADGHTSQQGLCFCRYHKEKQNGGRAQLIRSWR